VTAEPSIVSGLSGRYATALFDLAAEQKSVDPVRADLDTLAAMIDDSDDLAQLIRSPAVARSDQAKAMAAILAKSGIKGLVANFVGTVAENGRLSHLQTMIRQYRLLVSRFKGEIAAEVTSAQKLEDTQISSIEKSLAKAVGREVQLSTKVDPGVLGGLVVRVGSRMIDSSLRTQLNSLQLSLKEVG
jgi:F-type H+-transporting ATPase subunit delta